MSKLKFITLEQLLEMFENNEKFRLVEVLSQQEYSKEHIPEAINIPLSKLETVAPKKLKKTETIVVYCESYTCYASTKAAKKLLEMGYKDVLDFKGGKRWWRHAGLEMEHRSSPER